MITPEDLEAEAHLLIEKARRMRDEATAAGYQPLRVRFHTC